MYRVAQMREMESQHARNNDATGSPEEIPKPKGSPGNGYSLREEMGLGAEEDKLEYNKILVSCKSVCCMITSPHRMPSACIHIAWCEANCCKPGHRLGQ